MALINHAKREINAKIVYYGREGSGKHASMQYLYNRIKPLLRGELKTVPASGDSLFFFDFSPFEYPVFGGYHVRFHISTLIGKVANPAAWKMILKGADGVVIVADASTEMIPATREDISKLRGFLAAYGVGLHDIPCVLQLNRFGNAWHSFEPGIAAELDVPGMRTCFSVDGSGEGVQEAISLLSNDIMTRIGQNEELRRVGGCTPTSAVGTQGDESPVFLPFEPLEGLKKSRSARLILEESPLRSEVQEKNEKPCECLQVSLVGEETAYSDGAVRIPLDITLGRVSRRLVVTINIDLE